MKTLVSVAASASDKVTENPFSTGPLFNFPLVVAQKALNLAMDDYFEQKKNSKSGYVDMGDGYELRMDNGYVQGICTEKDENVVREGQMEEHVGKLFPVLKLISEAAMQTVLEGNLTDIQRGVSYLAAMISRPTLNRAIDQMNDGLSIYERFVLSLQGTQIHANALIRDVAQLVEELYISYAWANSQCYVKGNIVHDEGAYNGLCHPTAKTKWWNQESRLCDPDTRTVVQAQCLTNRDKDNREIPLIGIKGLEKSHLSLNQVLRDSLRNYREFGPLGIQPKDLARDPFWQDSLMNRNVSLVNLPMCFSQLIAITDYDNKEASGGWKHLNQNFPSTCGNDGSSETKFFADRIGVGYNQTHFLNGDLEELMESIAPHVSGY
jgi:hypothetical protein